MAKTVVRAFPRAPRALVEGMLGEEYQRLRSERLGGTGVPEITWEGGRADAGGGPVTVRFPRRLPLDDVPGPLRSLAGGGELVQVERWHLISDERCAATFTTESAMPGTVSGTYEVVPAAGGGATFTVVASATIRVPLIGGRIAREVEGHVANLVEAEMDLAAEFLAER